MVSASSTLQKYPLCSLVVSTSSKCLVISVILSMVILYYMGDNLKIDFRALRMKIKALRMKIVDFLPINDIIQYYILAL